MPLGVFFGNRVQNLVFSRVYDYAQTQSYGAKAAAWSKTWQLRWRVRDKLVLQIDSELGLGSESPTKTRDFSETFQTALFSAIESTRQIRSI